MPTYRVDKVFEAQLTYTYKIEAQDEGQAEVIATESHPPDARNKQLLSREVRLGGVGALNVLDESELDGREPLKIVKRKKARDTFDVYDGRRRVATFYSQLAAEEFCGDAITTWR